jgi:hypothetical protein
MLGGHATASLAVAGLSQEWAYLFGAIYVIFALLVLWAWVRIIGQAGYPKWWVLVGFVPVVNVVMFFFFALREWPVRREVTMLRRASLRGNMNYASYGPTYSAPAQYGPPK